MRADGSVRLQRIVTPAVVRPLLESPFWTDSRYFSGLDVVGHEVVLMGAAGLGLSGWVVLNHPSDRRKEPVKLFVYVVWVTGGG